MSACRFHPHSEAIAYCVRCRARFCHRCGQVERSCALCHQTPLTPPPDMETEAPSQRPPCPHHPEAVTTKSCHDCGTPFCPACLDWQGLCSTCAPRYASSPPRVQSSPPRPTPPQRPLSRGVPRFKGLRLKATRIGIGVLVLGSLGAWLSFQYGLLKDTASQVSKSREPLSRLTPQTGDLNDLLARIESGEVSEADVEATERLISRLETGEPVDTSQRDALEQLAAVFRRTPPDARAAAPRAEKLGALLSQWANEDRALGVSLPGPKRPKPKATTVPKAVSWKVALLSPAAGAQVKGIVTVDARIEGQEEIDRVEFLVNGEWQGLSNRPPFTFDWNTRGGSNGPKTLEIVAYEPSGAKHASRRIRVTVAN